MANMDMTECRDYHKVSGNATDVCNFINSTDDCQMDEGFIEYMIFAFCKVPLHAQPAVFTLYAIWLIFLFVALGTTAESFFCPCLEYIAESLKLSHNIAGVTVVAFGNGAPDIFSALAAFTNSSPSAAGVAVGSLLGAGVFVTTVVAGAVALVKPFKIAERPFLRDVIFYLWTTFWVFCLLYFGSITLPNSIGFLLLYLGYGLVVVIGRYINQKQRKRHARSAVNETNEDEAINERRPLISPLPTVEEEVEEIDEADWTDQHLHSKFPKKHHLDNNNMEADNNMDDRGKFIEKVRTNLQEVWRGLNPISDDWSKMAVWEKCLEVFKSPLQLMCNLTIPLPNIDSDDMHGWNRPLNSAHCVFTPLFCLFITKGGDITIGSTFPLWALFLIVGTTFGCLVWFTSTPDQVPKYHWVFAYVGFVASVIWTYTIANEIVNLLRSFGAIIDVTNVIMGLTFLAWGNSIGDMVADVSLAKRDSPRMAISACFGGPLFNLLVGIGLPCTVSIIKTGHPISIKYTTLEAVLAGGLMFSLVYSLISLVILKFRVGKSYAISLFIIYAVFLLLAILAGVEVI